MEMKSRLIPLFLLLICFAGLPQKTNAMNTEEARVATGAVTGVVVGVFSRWLGNCFNQGGKLGVGGGAAAGIVGGIYLMHLLGLPRKDIQAFAALITAAASFQIVPVEKSK